MHDLQQTAKDCINTLAELGIACGNIRSIEVDKRTRRSWGTCRQLPDGGFRIGISPRLLAEEVPHDSLKQTLYHELLHAAAYGQGHRGQWKMLAQRVNAALGTSIGRTATWEQQGVDLDSDATVRYRFACTGCGQKLVRFRACAFTRHYKRYRCGVCGGRFRPA